MHLLHLTSHLNVGGITSNVVSIAREMVRRDHTVTVAAGSGPLRRQLAEEGIRYWPVPLSTSAEFSLQVLWSVWQLAKRLAQEPVDLIHAHTRVSQVVADRLSRRMGIPYVTTWHGFYRPRYGRRKWPCAGERTIAISGPVREHLINDFKVSSWRVRLIKHGIDVARYETPIDLAARQRLRQQLKLPASGLVVGTMARLVKSKGVDQFIESARHVIIITDGVPTGLGTGASLESLGRDVLGEAMKLRMMGASLGVILIRDELEEHDTSLARKLAAVGAGGLSVVNAAGLLDETIREYADAREGARQTMN